MTLISVVIVAGIGLYQLSAWQKKWAHDHVIDSGGMILRLKKDEPIYSVDLSNSDPDTKVDVAYVNSYFPIVTFKASPNTDDADVATLTDIPDLVELNLADCQVTDAGMDSVAKLTKLTSLTLEGTQVTDAGIAKLAPLKELKLLDASSIPVGPAGMKVIGGLKQLDELQLDNTGLKDAWLASLKELPDLRVLDLGRNDLTDAGLKHIAGLFTLSELRLDETQVTNAGVAHLSELWQLKILALDRTRVNDTCIEHLKDLGGLDQITGITKAGIAKLEELQTQRSEQVGLFKVIKGGANSAFLGFAGRDQSGASLRGGLEIATVPGEKARVSSPTAPGVVTRVNWTGKVGKFSHSQLPLGEYTVFLRMGNFYDNRWVRVDGTQRQMRKDFEINPTNAATLEITVPAGVETLTFYQLKRYSEGGTNEDFPAAMGVPVAVENGSVTIRLMPNTYRFRAGDKEVTRTPRTGQKLQINLAN